MVELKMTGIQGIPEVTVRDDLALLIIKAASTSSISIDDGDILVVTQKIVSKAEGRVVKLSTIEASPFAIQLSENHHRDPRHTEVILRESTRIVRMDQGTIISETRHGFICANAGVDASNLPLQDTVCLLPLDPDKSAQAIRRGIKSRINKTIAVIISDTFGRPWREGAINVAIGTAGIDPTLDYRGLQDSYGSALRSTVIVIADELASAADLVMGKLEGVPAAIIKGYSYKQTSVNISTLVRARDRDLFR